MAYSFKKVNNVNDILREKYFTFCICGNSFLMPDPSFYLNFLLQQIKYPRIDLDNLAFGFISIISYVTYLPIIRTLKLAHLPDISDRYTIANLLKNQI